MDSSSQSGDRRDPYLRDPYRGDPYRGDTGSKEDQGVSRQGRSGNPRESAYLGPVRDPDAHPHDGPDDGPSDGGDHGGSLANDLDLIGPPEKTKERSGLLEAFVLVLIALVLALTLKTYVAEAYEIKGRSMEPTFLNGQRVVVLKAFYEIEREDVIVFASTEDPSKDLIKRVVGLPGETLKVAGGQVYINGRKLAENYAKHDLDRELRDTPKEERIPGRHYYVLGDNRPDSHDSRNFLSIPQECIRGKVVMRWWPFSQFKAFGRQ
jgi:signal peptidase I